MKYQVTAPSPVTGLVVGVQFTGGRATVDPQRHRAALAYFHRNASYQVTALPEDDTEAAAADTPEERQGDGNPDAPEGQEAGDNPDAGATPAAGEGQGDEHTERAGGAGTASGGEDGPTEPAPNAARKAWAEYAAAIGVPEAQVKEAKTRADVIVLVRDHKNAHKEGDQ